MASSLKPIKRMTVPMPSNAPRSHHSESLILITGGAGFIGQYLARALQAAGYAVRVVDNFSPQIHAEGALAPGLPTGVDIIRADVRDRAAMSRALVGVETVVHLAAETGTGQSMYEIDRYFSVNVQGTAVLLDLLQNDPCGKSVKKIVVASSRAIYGEGAYRCKEHGLVFPDQRTRANLTSSQFEPTCPVCNAATLLEFTHETAPFKPMSIYGLTKQVQEQAVLLFARTNGVSGFALRYQNVYGPGQSLKNPYTGILAVFSNLARQGEPIEIYEDGAESRDFVYIDDVVEATLRCVQHKPLYAGAFNVGSGVATTVMDVALAIKAHFESRSPVRVTGAFRLGDIRHNVADISLMRSILGFEPRTGFQEGITAFLGWAGTQPAEDRLAYQRSVDELAARGLMGIGAKP